MINLKANPFFLSDNDIAWVEETLGAMSIEDKVGHLFCVLLKDLTEEELETLLGVLSPGAFMYRPGCAEKVLESSNRINARLKVPALIAANLEKGGNGIVAEGTLVGSHMEVAATDDETMAASMARVCALEAAAVGANWSFAPIVDIDTNFRNPITNTRTFGSDPERVIRMGLAYTKTIQQLGLAASVKHFPGDGQDERDQHLVTSINDMDCDTWMATYGDIYRKCFEAGALSCMVGHIMQPAWSKHLNPAITDEEIMPASLAPELMQGLMREVLGFNGLIVTDATTMAGYTIPMSRKKAVPYSIAAGADMFLFARNLEEDYSFMLEGVKTGIISPQRLDEAITRILAMKAALGLHKDTPTLSTDKMKSIIGCAEHIQISRDCADKAITLVKEQKGILPLTPARYPRVLFYPIEPEEGGCSAYRAIAACGKFVERLRVQGFEIDVFEPPTGNEGFTPPYMDVVNKYDLILYVANITTKSNQTVVRIEWKQPMGADCGHYLSDVPTVFVSLENPYHLLDFPRVKTYINCYSNNENVLDALIEKLMGRSEFKGTSPVDAFCGKWDTHL